VQRACSRCAHIELEAKLKLALSVLAAVLLLAAPASARESNYRGLQGIRWANPYCESGGNIHAISATFWVHGHPVTYRGKWQFDQQTWHTYAPAGWKNADPAWAPEWVQDKAALAVPYDAWPNC